MKHKIFLIVAFLFLLKGHSQRPPNKKVKPFNTIESAKTFLKNQEQKGLFSGAVYLSKGGKAFIYQAYGLADKEKNIVNTTDTKFNIGSINKAFTAVSVMQLVEAGKLSLNEKIVKYIPELKMPMADEITIQHLLEMTAGLGSYWDSELFQKNLKKLNNLEDYLPIITNYNLSSKPGTKRQYSNSSYELLGILVQRISGVNYYDYVRHNIYKKAGMQNTDSYKRLSTGTALAQGYTKYEFGEMLSPNKKGAYTRNIAQRQPIKGTAAGGGYSTLDNLKKFLLALHNNKFLSKTSTDLVINKFRPYKARKNLIQLRGGSYGVNAIATYNADLKTVVIVLSNYDPPTASEIAKRLSKTINKNSDTTFSTSDKKQILKLIEQFQLCIETKNLEAFIPLFIKNEKVSWVGNGSFGTQYGSPSNFIAQLQGSNAAYREDFHNIKIWNDALIATVTFDYGFFTNEHLANWGKESWMLIKQEDTWKITSVNYSMILPTEKDYPYKTK